MKTIAVTQPYLFPYIGYFQIMNAVDEYVFYDDVQYIVRGWINRNNILINKQKNLFTISLDNASANKNINEIEIKDDFVKFQRTLEMAYAKAPYRNEVLSLVEDICAYEDKNLARFTANSLKIIAGYLQLTPVFRFSSDIDNDKALKGQDKMLDICKILNADVYINTYGGVELYDTELFRENNIELQFLKAKTTEYTQLKNEFVDGLSILDVMMFNSVDEIKKMLGNYEIIK